MISTLRLSRFSVCKLSICFVILVLFQTANLFAEDYLSSPGFRSFTPMQNVESGAINLANGNIHIDIPVSSAPARGRFDNTQKLVFDGRFWQIMDIGTQKLWEPNSLSPVSIGTPFNNGTGGWRYSRNLSNSLTNDE